MWKQESKTIILHEIENGPEKREEKKYFCYYCGTQGSGEERETQADINLIDFICHFQEIATYVVKKNISMAENEKKNFSVLLN